MLRGKTTSADGHTTGTGRLRFTTGPSAAAHLGRRVLPVGTENSETRDFVRTANRKSKNGYIVFNNGSQGLSHGPK